MAAGVSWRRYLVAAAVALAVMWLPWVPFLVGGHWPRGGLVTDVLGGLAIPTLIPATLVSLELPFGDFFAAPPVEAMLYFDLDRLSSALFFWVLVSVVVCGVLTFLGSRGTLWQVLVGAGCLVVEGHAYFTFMSWIGI